VGLTSLRGFAKSFHALLESGQRPVLIVYRAAS
jgi:hypothetical protein